MIATLLIQRGAEEPERFAVPFSPGQTVLDGLRHIRRHADPSLAFRYACLNANACKECMMLIDGTVAYACTTRLREGAQSLAPLPNKPLVRDLVTEIAPPDERLRPPSDERLRPPSDERLRPPSDERPTPTAAPTGG